MHKKDIVAKTKKFKIDKIEFSTDRAPFAHNVIVTFIALVK